MEHRLRVLVVEDQLDDAELMMLALRQGGLDPTWERVETSDELTAALANGPWDAVLSDYTLPECGAMAALAIVRGADLDVPFLVVSGTVGEEVAVMTMRAGANDYVLKHNLTRLAPALIRELREADNRRARKRASEATRQSEQRYRRLFEAAQDGILILDAKSRKILEGNPFLANLLGYQPGELIGKELWQIGLFPDIEANRAAFRTLQEVGYIRYEDLPLRAKDGRQIQVEFVSNSYEVGDACVIQCNIRDITDRKRAEEALRASEERNRQQSRLLQSILDNMSDGVVVANELGKFLLFNPAAEQMLLLGLIESAPEDWQAIYSLYLPDGTTPYPTAENPLVMAIHGAPSNGIEMIVNHDRVKEPRWLNVNARPMRDDAGILRGGIAVLRNITENKRAEQVLLDTQQRLEKILTSSPAVLFTLSVADGQVRGIDWISENLREMLGYTPADALVKGWWLENIHPQDREELITRTHERLFGPEPAAHEFRFRHKNGDFRWTRGEIRMIRDAGRPTEAVGSWSDVTARKLLEEQFRQAQKMEAFGQLAGGVAHDFNNLLTVINGYSDLLLDSLPAEDPTRNMIVEIHKAGERSAGLTRQLLAFSRQQVLAPQVLNLNEVVFDTDKLLRRLIGEDIRLTTTLDSDPWAIRADPGQIEQVLMNLAVNARDAMPAGGRLTIETMNVELDETYSCSHKDARKGPHVLLSVTDSGCGIPPDAMAKLFEPFFTTKELGKGTGLGLATVYGIVNQSGGHVAVDSEVGIGTTFKVYLPRFEATSQELKPSSRTLTAPRGTETVLVAEDEAGVRTLTTLILTECGYTVLEAAEGNEATRLAAEHDAPIHLLITDVVMPGAGGRAVAEQVAERHPETRVLYVSGYTDDAVIRHGVLRDGVEFLQKPFSPVALAFKVRAILDTPQGSPNFDRHVRAGAQPDSFQPSM